MLGMDPIQADDRLLAAALVASPTYYRLFLLVFKMKRAFESTWGLQYTSKLYFTTAGFQPSFTLNFHDQSAYTEDEKKNDVKGIEFERRWKKILQDIWRGTCFSKAYLSRPSFIEVRKPIKIENKTYDTIQ